MTSGAWRESPGLLWCCLPGKRHLHILSLPDPDHAILTPSDDHMVCVPCWPLHHAAAGYGSFWAPGRGNAGQGLSIDIPQGQVGSRTGNNGARDVTDGNGRYALPVGRQAGHVGKAVQVPQNAGAVLGATHQEVEGD